MTIITAKVIAASKNYNSVVWSLQLQYPRFIHSEFMTHGMFSKSASSSRAIPVHKMLSQVWSSPAEPVHWGKNQSGMQAKEQLTGWKLKAGQLLWRTAAKAACVFVYFIDALGGHKQWANRILEPWQYIHVIVTATEWENFFNLRDHPDAQPEMQVLAQQIKAAMACETPVNRHLAGGEKDRWHLPYVTDEERQALDLQTLVAVSTARCARVSYLTHDAKVPSVESDLKLFDRLVGSVPEHASPTEHQALTDTSGYPHPSYKLRGFFPHRWLRDHKKPLNYNP